jgi:regulator of protease activity HflC (stomatin/prohibitin superfamily)
VTGNAVLAILVVLPVLALVVVALVNAVSIIQQSTAGVIERLGRDKTTAGAGMVLRPPSSELDRRRGMP